MKITYVVSIKVETKEEAERFASILKENANSVDAENICISENVDQGFDN